MFRGNILSVVLALLLAVPAAFAEDAAVASVAEAGPNAALVTPPAAPADRPAPISPQAREALSKSPLSKPVTTSTSPVAALEAAAAPTFDNPAVPLSGVVLMPTAYRGRGVNKIGPNLDINGAYFIGRLYGKNSLSWTTSKKNYLDRIGLWMLSLDAKMMVQTETTWRKAKSAPRRSSKFMPALFFSAEKSTKSTGAGRAESHAVSLWRAAETPSVSTIARSGRAPPKTVESACLKSENPPPARYDSADVSSLVAVS